MPPYAMDEQGVTRRKTATKRMKTAQMAAQLLQAMLGDQAAPGGHGVVAPAAAAVPALAASGGPKLPAAMAAGAQAAPIAPQAPGFKNVSGGPKAPPGVTAEQLKGYEKYAGDPLEALARRLARKKAGIHLGGADNDKQAALARTLGLLPGSEGNAARPLAAPAVAAPSGATVRGRVRRRRGGGRMGVV